MYIHSVKLVNYKSIGNYDEAEVIIEPTVTAIIGKNESGKSNVLDGLSQIDFMGNKAPEKLNRTAAEGSQIKYIITIKPSPEDIVLSDTTIILSKNNYELTGGFLDHYHNSVKGYVDTLNEIVESLGGNPSGKSVEQIIADLSSEMLQKFNTEFVKINENPTGNQLSMIFRIW